MFSLTFSFSLITEGLQISQERLAKQTYDSSFIREHIHLVQPKTVENETNYIRKLKM